MLNIIIIYFHTEESVGNLVQSFLFYEKGEMFLRGKNIRVDFPKVSLFFSVNHEVAIHGRNNIAFPEGFISFSHVIAVEWMETESKEEAIDLIRELLLFLWNQNIPAVAVGKGQEMLPSEGGYNCEGLPWPSS